MNRFADTKILKRCNNGRGHLTGQWLKNSLVWHQEGRIKRHRLCELTIFSRPDMEYLWNEIISLFLHSFNRYLSCLLHHLHQLKLNKRLRKMTLALMSFMKQILSLGEIPTHKTIVV